MSFLETNGKGAGWLAAPVRRSLSLTPGCAQCGRGLEVNSQGVFALSGKCESCTNRVFDEDEITDELEY